MGKTFTFRADQDLAAVLHDEAQAQCVSVSRLVRDACRARLSLDAVEIDRRQFNRIGVGSKGSVSNALRTEAGGQI